MGLAEHPIFANNKAQKNSIISRESSCDLKITKNNPFNHT